MENNDRTYSSQLINSEVLILSENKNSSQRFLNFLNVKIDDDEINETSNTIINNNSLENENEKEISQNSLEISEKYFLDIPDEKKELTLRLNFNNQDFTCKNFFHCFIILSDSKYNEISQFKSAIDLFSQKLKKAISKTDFNYLLLIIEEIKNDNNNENYIEENEVRLLQKFFTKEKKNYLSEKNLEKFILLNLDYSDRNHCDSFIEFLKTKMIKSFSKFPENFQNINSGEYNASSPKLRYVNHIDIINRIHNSKRVMCGENVVEDEDSLSDYIQTDEKEEFLTFEENSSKYIDNEDLDHAIQADELKSQKKNKNRYITAELADGNNTGKAKNKIPIPRGNIRETLFNQKWEKFENFSFVKDLKQSQVNSAVRVNPSTVIGNVNRSNLHCSKSKEKKESNQAGFKNSLANSTLNASSNSVKNLHHKRVYSEFNLNKLKFGESFTANTDRSSERIAKNPNSHRADESLMTLYFKYKNNVLTHHLTAKHTGYSIATEVDKFFYLNLSGDSKRFLSKKIIRKINKFIKLLKNSKNNSRVETNSYKDFIIDMDKILKYEKEEKIKVIVTVDNSKIIFYIKKSPEPSTDEYLDEIIKCIQHKDTYDINSLKNQIKSTLNNSIKSTV